MAVALVRDEMRRHFVMNCCLVAAAVVAGTAITNERGVFSPLGFNPFSATAQALAQLANPVTGLREIRNVPAAVPLTRGLRTAPPFAAVPDAAGPPLTDVLAPPPPAVAAPVGPGALTPEEGGGVPGTPGAPAFPGIPGLTVPPGPSIVPEGLVPDTDTPGIDNPPAVPEPASWAMMIGGFGLTGVVVRLATARRRRMVV